MTTPIDRPRLVARGLQLEVISIAWNVLEAAAAVLAGYLAKSIALTSFGLDSLIEVVAAGALLHRLRAESRGREASEALERRALWIVAVTFFGLTAYVVLESGLSLWHRSRPESSPLGIAVTVLALIVMPLLARAKLRVGRAIGSAALVADAKESFACAWLAAAALLGVALNTLWGWWWADPVAALGMVPFLVREGREALQEARGGEGCHQCEGDD